ncbi:Os01g0274300, partial [Oryza sativa Japonica Group]
RPLPSSPPPRTRGTPILSPFVRHGAAPVPASTERAYRSPVGLHLRLRGTPPRSTLSRAAPPLPARARPPPHRRRAQAVRRNARPSVVYCNTLAKALLASKGASPDTLDVLLYHRW